jgi:hypothetical protein
MVKILSVINLMVAALITYALLHQNSAPELNRPNTILNKTPSGSTREPQTPIDTVETVKARIEQKLRAQFLAKFLSRFENPDTLHRTHLYSIQEGIYNNYSELLKALGLPPERTMRLAVLLSRRETSMKYYLNLPKEIEDAGVPTSFTFGAAEIEEIIKSEFGQDVYLKVKAFDAELPIRREQAELAEILASMGKPLEGEAARRLGDILRSNPLPVQPKKEEHGNDFVDYHQKRMARVDLILNALAVETTGDVQNLLREYLLQKEEAAINVTVLQNSKTSPRKS